MTQAQSAAQKKRGMARPGTDATGKHAGRKRRGTGAARKRPGGKPEPQEKPTPGPAAPEAQRKKRAAGFPAAHMEKDAVTPT